MSENDADISDERIIDEFVLRKKRRNITVGLFLLFLALGLPCIVYFIDDSITSGETNLLGLLLVLLIFTCLGIFELINWRCPLCSRYLGLVDNPDNCPYCRTRLKY